MTRSIANDLASEAVDARAAGRRLVAGIAAQPWGQLSPSTYETARLVTLAPWLVGHGRRVEHLLRTQDPDGSWGGPDGYALAPTLSATEALLSTVRRVAAGDRPEADQRVGYGALVDAADRGLRALFDRLGGGAGPSADPPVVEIPDTPAVELIVPALVAAVNGHLDRVAGTPPKGLDGWRGPARLRLPAGSSGAVLAGVRRRLAGGVRVPEKLLHSLEVVGPDAWRSARIEPAAPGTVGASPAATAAWLATGPAPGRAQQAMRYLDTVVERHGGPVPSVIPVTFFESAWVLSTLADAGIPLDVPSDLVVCLAAAVGPRGTPGGAGLPPDADTTSVVLRTLTHLGARTVPDCLAGYETATHFCTWQGERSFSTTTNAHVLEAYGAAGGSATPGVRAKLSRWLVGQQRPDGSWTDKWHASPYYATGCCALALHRYGHRTDGAVRRAVDWTLATQRPDGSWGRWSGTAEETAYALRLVLAAAPSTHPGIDAAVDRGYRYLRRAIHHPDDTPLWHDKDRYRPAAIVRAAVIAALHLAQRRIRAAANPTY